jgi:hypothetical protein
MKITRRALAGMAALSAVPLTKSAAQSPPAQSNTASRPFQDAGRKLASVKLARTVEPVTRFEA